MSAQFTCLTLQAQYKDDKHLNVCTYAMIKCSSQLNGTVSFADSRQTVSDLHFLVKADLEDFTDTHQLAGLNEYQGMPICSCQSCQSILFAKGLIQMLPLICGEMLYQQRCSLLALGLQHAAQSVTR